MQLLRDVHKGATYLGDTSKPEVFVQGTYEYYHYGCDGCKDQGWGCGYRTLQTLCSWVRLNHKENEAPRVPSIPDIQTMLVEMDDKPPSFINSREWIGSIEASFILSHVYDWDCKIMHLSSGVNFSSIISDLVSHLEQGGGPIMAGGDIDCSAKCIVGVRGNNLLIVDPHFSGSLKDKNKLQDSGYVRWYELSEFLSSSFYNLCLPIPRKIL